MSTRPIAARDPWVALFSKPIGDGTVVPNLTLPELPAPKGRNKLTKTDSAVLEAIANGDLVPHDAIKNLIELYQAGKISQEDALLRADPTRIAEMYLPTFNDGKEVSPIAEGTPVSQGCASGRAVFDVKEAEARADRGEDVVLVIRAVEPQDVEVIGKVKGVIFATGGYGQHTAVVARDHGIPAVNGSEVFTIDGDKKVADLDGHVLKDGQPISLDGRTGEIYQGIRTVKRWSDEPKFQLFMAWAQKHQGIGVWSNADSPEAATLAFQRGAKGIGLCRTEHMFFAEDRMPILQSAVLAWNAKTRAPFLEKLGEWQRGDFTEMYRAAQGKPVAIRLLDPPRHELLPVLEPSNLTVAASQFEEILGVPKDKIEAAFKNVFDVYENTDVLKLIFRIEEEPDTLKKISKELGVSTGEIRNFIKKYTEKNPMTGIRGVRLGVEIPEIYDMQIRAILQAAATANKEGIATVPKITIPMLGLGLSHDDASPKEITFFRERIEAIKAEVEKETGTKLKYQLGAMIETPAAAVESGTIGSLVDYFSYGTNDLTSLMLGADRENQRLISLYEERGMLDGNPFQELHPTVAKMLAVSAFFGRFCGPTEKRDLMAGVCGEQGADPKSVSRMRQAGMDYVSVSGAGMMGSIVASAQDKIRYERGLDADLNTVLPKAPPRTKIVGNAVLRGSE
jgi:pyruvate, orthophosphate dikinase